MNKFRCVMLFLGGQAAGILTAIGAGALIGRSGSAAGGEILIPMVIVLLVWAGYSARALVENSGKEKR